MKKPGDCASIDEIRKSIDSIDHQIISLLSERLGYVKEIVKFKKDEEDIRAKKRFDEVIQIRRNWAEDGHLDPNVIEKIYRLLMQYFIEIQKEVMLKRRSVSKQA